MFRFVFVTIAAWISFVPIAVYADDTLPRRPGAVDEIYPGHTVTYDQIASTAGNRVRMIATVPDGKGPFATVFVVGWLSCDTVEAADGTHDPSLLVFRKIATLGDVALVRMEKEGVGDSEGNCAATDFSTELDDYRRAFAHALSYNFVDKSRLYIFGVSNGGGFAPLVTETTPVAGYLVDGGWMKTWFEHMMELERRRLKLGGASAGKINSLMRDEASFYTRFLVAGETPRAIFKSDPGLVRIWDQPDSDHQYGRPVTFYQQLQALNLAEAWSHVAVPALIMHGQYDWVMSEDDLKAMAAMIQTNGAQARFVSLPSTGHTFEHFANEADSYANRALPFDPKPAELIANWLETQVKTSGRASH